mgnify:CR=1 FL=1
MKIINIKNMIIKKIIMNKIKINKMLKQNLISSSKPSRYFGTKSERKLVELFVI